MKHFRTRDLAAVLLAMFLPLNTLFLLRTYPTFFLQGVGDCRQIRVPEVQFPKPTCVCIIGASHGLGKEMARTLNAHGYVRLIITGRTKERAENAIKGFDRSKMIHTAGLDLEDVDSVGSFASYLRHIVEESCNSQLDYLFLNAGQIYADGYDEAYTSKDGKYDRLLSSNFIGYVHFLKNFHRDLQRLNTRTVFVASIAHYTGLQEDVLTPNLASKNGTIDQMIAYHTSKLALVTMQQILAKDERVPNSLAVTCGSVLTHIDVKPSQRDSVNEVPSAFPPLFRNWFQLTSQQGAEVVLNSAFIPRDEIKVGEFVLPYFFGFTDSLYMKNTPHKVKAVLNIWYEQFLQKLTYKKGHLWICPASMESRDESFQKQVNKKYLNW
jgi:NAD(P)-dependent dehydrogenase (short-subunit alcohol dehydrogenase family)